MLLDFESAVTGIASHEIVTACGGWLGTGMTRRGRRMALQRVFAAAALPKYST
jgi:hypothetical protein